MDSLRPDRDDLDLYNSRKSKKKAGPLSSDKLSASDSEPSMHGEKTGPGQASSKREAVGTSRVSAHASDRRSGSTQNNSSSSKAVLTLLILAFAALSVLGWLFWQQQHDLKDLEARLSNSDEFMGQSKLLIARLEGAVSETGVELQQTGSDAEKKLAVLESEVKKLWGVAYDRNRKALKKNADQISQLEIRLAAGTKELKAVQTVQKRSLEVLDSRVSSVSGALSITRAELEESLASLRSITEKMESQVGGIDPALERLQVGVEVNAKNLKDNAATLASVDDSRRQLIKRLVDLEGRLNKLSVTGATKVQ